MNFLSRFLFYSVSSFLFFLSRLSLGLLLSIFLFRVLCRFCRVLCCVFLIRPPLVFILGSDVHTRLIFYELIIVSIPFLVDSLSFVLLSSLLSFSLSLSPQPLRTSSHTSFPPSSPTLYSHTVHHIHLLTYHFSHVSALLGVRPMCPVRFFTLFSLALKLYVTRICTS